MDIDDQTLAQDCNPENFSTSPVQDEYAPVILSQRTISHIVSIDMMSGKEDRDNILRARASGKGALTSPFKLLNPITWASYARDAYGYELDACQLDYAQTAHDSGKDLILLINKVLDHAKIESGRLELEAVPFDPRAVLDKVLSIFSGKSHEKGIELAAYVSENVPEVVIGDQERFGQIITNLVGNSIKFTHDKGHILVSVHLADEVQFPLDVKDRVLRQSLNVVRDDSNASFNTLSGFPVVDKRRSWENFKNLGDETEKIKLLVTIEDTVTGIPHEGRARIFTPFMQADSSTSRKYSGTGIGLSISNRPVDLMGGEIGFASEVNTGSTFTFTATFTKADTNCRDKIRWPCDRAVSVFRGVRALVIDEKQVRARARNFQHGVGRFV